VDAGFPAGSDNVQTRLSGDGRFLATSCKMGSFACSPDLGSDDSVYLQNLVTKTDAGLPENPAGFTSRDEQHPCVNADGSVVGMDVPNPNATTRDIFLYDRGGAAWVTLPAGVMDLATTPNANDTGCRLDSSGSYLGFDDAAFNFHVYDRAHDGFLLLPPGAASPVETVWLTQPYPPPATGGGGPSGGGGGPAPPGGGDTPPPAPPAPPAEPAARDTKPPTISLRVAARQRVRKGFVAVVSCDEPCALTVKATVGTGRGVALGTKRRGLARGQFRARFKVSRRTAARISRLLRRSRRPVKAVVIVRAVDAAGNAASKKRPVRVR
jgi:hypothetical protein